MAPVVDDIPRARGIVLYPNFGSVVAQVVEVLMKDGKSRVHRVVCAIGCGTTVNPGIVAQQMESTVISGLTAALYGRIDTKDGQVVQSNFPNYPALKMVETPVIETHIVPSVAEPSGMDGAGVPPIAPAMARTMTQLTDKSVRQLPMV